MQAIILAGGFGTRLRNVINDKPKSLATVGNKPFLYWQLKWLATENIESVFIATHYLSDQIESYIETDEIRNLNMVISIVRERNPLGTGGAIKNVFKKAKIDKNILIINGDTLHNFQIKKFYKFHNKNKSLATLMVSKLADAHRYGTVEVFKNKITKFNMATGQHKQGWINCGAYIFHPNIIINFYESIFSIEANFFPKLVGDGVLFAYKTNEDYTQRDIGIPDTYLKINQQFKKNARQE